MNIPAQKPAWHIGAGGGATQYTRYQAQSFARGLLTSESYRLTLEDRILNKTLPPAIEQMLWHYAFGKPIEEVRVQVSQVEDLSTLSLDELYARAGKLRETIDEAKALENAIPAQVVAGPW